MGHDCLTCKLTVLCADLGRQGRCDSARPKCSTRCFRMGFATRALSPPTGFFPLPPQALSTLLAFSFPALFLILGPSSYPFPLHFRPLSSFPAPLDELYCSPEMLDEMFPDGVCDAGTFSPHRPFPSPTTGPFHPPCLFISGPFPHLGPLFIPFPTSFPAPFSIFSPS